MIPSRFDVDNSVAIEQTDAGPFPKYLRGIEAGGV